MLGRVTWTQFDRQWQAILNNDRTWTVPDDPALAGLLNTLYDPAAVEWGPADGHFGPVQLHELADLLGGVAEIEPREPTRPPEPSPIAVQVYQHLGIKAGLEPAEIVY